jgi:hypothetical protein
MKYEIKLVNTFFFLIILFLIVSCAKNDAKKYVSTKSNEFNTTIEFEKKIYSFGKIPSMDTVGTIFRFKNKGKKPLVIQHVSSSCGCTIPKWPMNQIEPNGCAIIKVIYDAKEHGHFNKTISVFYNGKNSPLLLTIEGEVVDAKDNQVFSEIN